MAVLGVLQYKAGTGAIAPGWDLSNATYTGKSFNVGAQEAVANQVVFSPDGLKMFIIGQLSDSVHQYSLTTPWELTGGNVTHDGSFSVSAQESSPQSLYFRDNGLSFVIVGAGSDSIHKYDMLAPWDITSLTVHAASHSVSGQSTSPSGITVSPNGLNMYVVSASPPTGTVYQYSTSSAWDVNSLAYDSIFVNIGAQAPAPSEVVFSSDGLKMFISDRVNNTIFQYSLSTPLDIASASYDNVSVVAPGTDTRGFTISPDGSRMYVVCEDDDTVFQYTL
jgi:6-phosphogluconolactonase (cycloisomerase 2 family)